MRTMATRLPAKAAETNAKLAAALKLAGITTIRKRREAFARGANKVSGSVIGAAGRSEKDVLRRLAKKARRMP